MHTKKEINEIIAQAFPGEKEIIFAIWEESGGHTFNLFHNKDGKLSSEFPIIGDKYPVPAILVLCALLEMDYDFNKYIADIGRGRTTISATDLQKIQYIDNLKSLIGKNITLDNLADFLSVASKLILIKFIMLLTNTG